MVKRVFRDVNACALGLVFSMMWVLFEQMVPLDGSNGYRVVIAGVAFVTDVLLRFSAPIAIILRGTM